MKRIVYTCAETKNLCVLCPAPKEQVLKFIRGLSKEEMAQFILNEIKKRKSHDKFIFNWQSLYDFALPVYKGIWDSEFEDEFFEKLVKADIPTDAINPRDIDDKDIPKTREFRQAWCDVTPTSQIDIDLVKAKQIKLEQLRSARDIALRKTDETFSHALSVDDKVKIDEIKKQKQYLRDITEPLKNIKVEGYNDDNVLEKLKELSDVNLLEWKNQ